MFFECGLEYLEKWMKHAATCSNMQQHAFLEVAETCKKKHAFSRGACFARSGAAKKMHVSYQLLTHKKGEPCIFI